MQKRKQFSESELFLTLSKIIIFHSSPYPLDSGKREECTAEFIEWYWLKGCTFVTPSKQLLPDEAWLHQCASNHLKNYLRKISRLQAHEDCLVNESYTGSEEEQPETCLLRKEGQHQINQAIEHLTSVQSNIFRRHYLEDESVSSIALLSGRSENAIHQSLFTIRKHIKSSLERNGWSEVEMRLVFTPL